MAIGTSGKRSSVNLRHTRLYRLVFAVMVLAAFSSMLWFMIHSTSFMLFGEIVTRVDTDKKVVALTFDDGPLPSATEETLRIIKALNVRATFFIIGVEAERHAGQLVKIIKDGHEVGNHGYSHKPMTFMPYQGVVKEVQSVDKLIRSAGYTGPIHFRAPYNVKFITLPYYLMKHRRQDISRDVITKEGLERSPEDIASSIVRQVKPGSIILLHPMYKHTVSSRKAISLIVNELRAEGYSFVTVSQLLTYNKR